MSAPSARLRRRPMQWHQRDLYRYVHVLIGGGFAGVAGAALQLLDLTGLDCRRTLIGGAGWIAIALVIFAFWRRALARSSTSSGRFRRSRSPSKKRGRGVWLRAPYAIPYLMTIVASSSRRRASPSGAWCAPAALGIPYVREER